MADRLTPGVATTVTLDARRAVTVTNVDGSAPIHVHLNATKQKPKPRVVAGQQLDQAVTLESRPGVRVRLAAKGATEVRLFSWNAPSYTVEER
jgi:hypothetical protein